MLGVLLATHGSLAAGLLDAAAMILGSQPSTVALSVDRGMDPETIRESFAGALARLQRDCDGVLILTDMFGGTPANIAAEFLAPGRVELLAGANLPMVLKFFACRQSMPLAELARFLKQYGSQGIVDVGDLLQGNSTAS